MSNIDNDKKTTDHNPQEEGEKMPTVTKKENKGLSLSSEKLDNISVKPKVKNGKVLFDKNNKNHRYIVEEIVEEKY